MKLTTLWLVRDPGPQSELLDVVFEIDVQQLGNYAIGCGAGGWGREHHAMFTDKDEAVAEGIRRVVRSHPDREGWINEEAYRRFGYGALNAEGSIRQANARRRADERARHE